MAKFQAERCWTLVTNVTKKRRMMTEKRPEYSLFRTVV